jgi:hypothetical protein
MSRRVFSFHPLGRSLSLAARNWVNPFPTPPRLALHSQPATAAQSNALRNPAYAPKGGGDNVGWPLRGFIFWSNA